MKNSFGILFIAALVLLISKVSFSQPPTSAEWGRIFKSKEPLTIRKDSTMQYVLVIDSFPNGLTENDVVIVRTDLKGKELGGQEVKGKKIKEGENNKLTFNLSNPKQDLEAFKFAVKNKKDESNFRLLSIDIDEANQKDQQDSALISFLPSATDQDKWFQKPVPTHPPALNKHTRWMFEYDINREDPVLVWKNKAGTVKESNRLAPTVGRGLLITVKNYHPYRDSFVFAATYLNDRHLENAVLFTSTFVAATGAGARPSTEKPKETDSTGETEGTGEEEKSKPLTPYNKFKLLADQLDSFYRTRKSDPYVDVNVLANSIHYIKERMKKHLGITDFSEAGIIKRAEELAPEQEKNDNATSLKEYISVARRAAINFALVAGYNTFEKRNILIKNRDAIQLTLQRYRDGKLITSIDEASRTYDIELGVKVDFSLGLFTTGLKDRGFVAVQHWSQDTTFFKTANGITKRDSIVSIDSVERRQIVRDDLGKYDFGAAVFSHIYWRTGRDINVGGTIGISINQEGLPRFLFGGSLLFGKEARWVLSGGLAIGKVNDLATGYSENQIIPIPTQTNQLPTRQVRKESYFLALSFNFGGFTIGDD